MIKAIAAVLLMLSALALPARAAPLVFAAASLQDALNEVADLFVARGGRERPVISFAGSSTLARQIELGAPADIFLSASLAWMDYLEGRGEIAADSRVALLANELLLVAGDGMGEGESKGEAGRSLGALLADQNALIAMALVDSVPAGIYGQQALRARGDWEALYPSRIAQTDNVRAALTLAQRGEVAAAIVYASDLQASEGVSILHQFADGDHDPIRYPIALTREGASSERAAINAAFLAFLQSADAREVFVRWGFQPL